MSSFSQFVFTYPDLIVITFVAADALDFVYDFISFLSFKSFTWFRHKYSSTSGRCMSHCDFLELEQSCTYFRRIVDLWQSNSSACLCSSVCFFVHPIDIIYHEVSWLFLTLKHVEELVLLFFFSILESCSNLKHSECA